MKILIRQFLGGKNHSWMHVGIGLATGLLAQGHELHLFSTDGTGHLPESLKPYLIGYTEENKPEVFGRLPDKEYDCQVSYTCIKNFPFLLSNGSQNRFGWYVYEWYGKNVLPTGFAKGYKSCDVLFSPSSFGKEVFIDSGIPANHIQVLPHGIDIDQYQKTSTVKLPTDKKFKLCANIAQNHLRKNIPGLLEAYGKAFTNKDDVCLILKAKDKPIKCPFDVSLSDCISKFKKQFPQHAEIKIYSEYLEDISDLYRSIDAMYSLAHGEGFNMPILEGICSGKCAIVPNLGGHLDFSNENNSFLVSSKYERADPKSIYWEAKPNAMWVKPDTNDAAQKLQQAYKNYEIINKKLENQKSDIHQKYSWGNITKQMMEFCK